MTIDAVLALLEKAEPLGRLAQGAPAQNVTAVLKTATPESLLGAVKHEAAGKAVLTGLWTAADGFEEAHTIAQEIEGEWGDWWHAILHRREPDPSNSMYWYRRVKAPPAVRKALGAASLLALGAQPPKELKDLAEALRASGHWEPDPYVKACAKGQAGKLAPDAVAKLVELQRLEWSTWLDACRHAATEG